MGRLGRAEPEKSRGVSTFNSAAKTLGSKIHYEKYHQNPLAINKDSLYAILKRRVRAPFDRISKMDGFAGRINI